MSKHSLRILCTDWQDLVPNYSKSKSKSSKPYRSIAGILKLIQDKQQNDPIENINDDDIIK